MTTQNLSRNGMRDILCSIPNRGREGFLEVAVSRLVLLVDEDSDGRMILRAYLEHHGYEVLDTAEGEEALGLLRDHRPDLVIGSFPLNVPGHSPFTSAARSEHGYEGPILSVSARALPKEVEAAEATSSSVLLKPVAPATVLEEVRRLLGEE